MKIEFWILAVFCVALFASLLCGVPLLYALLFGLILFAGYGVRRASLRNVARMCVGGVKTARSILLLFVFIGMLTALWRAAGTIPVIVNYAVELIRPDVFLLLTFLLNSAMSLLTGTALGTAATMGVVCAAVGHTLGVDEAWMGGAILAGVYFGNRLSPISSMALLTANVTKSDIYKNIRQMLATTWLPFLFSCGIYLAVGANFSSGLSDGAAVKNASERFVQGFSMSPFSLVPAGVIVLLSVMRVRTSFVLLCSSLAAFLVALFVESQTVFELLKSIVFGYRGGGGLISMVNVFLIVVIAGCYGGIFKGTGMLLPLQGLVEKFAKKTNPFAATLASAALISCVVCNQTLTIILTNQMTENLEPEKQALNLYDTAVTVIALVPWSVATAIVLNVANAPNSAVLCACFLYLLPLCRLISSFFKRSKKPA